MSGLSFVGVQAFGLTLELPEGLDIDGLTPGVRERVPPDARVLIVSGNELADAWRGAKPSRTRELRHPDGDLLLTVDQDARRGFLLETPFHGRFLVSSDGREVLCAPLTTAGDSWHPLLTGQVLPLAAAARGVEVFHAGSVAVAGKAALLCGGSGVGKSTLVIRLLLRGAQLVTDDAAAVERTRSGTVVHPGTSRVRIDARDELLLSQASAAGMSVHAGGSKATLDIAPVDGPTAVHGVYLVQRAMQADSPASIEPVRPVAPTFLLGATLVRGVQTAARLSNHLETCLALADTPVYRVTLPTVGCTDAAADVVWEHLCRS